MERDFTLKGEMKGIPAAERKKLKGFLPFYSVDTREEADALIRAALEAGEFVRQPDGTLIEMTLFEEQTLTRLQLAGDRLAALHATVKKKGELFPYDRRTEGG